MSKRFFVILIAVLIGLAGIYWFSRDKASAPSGSTAKASNHVIGEGKTGVVLMEYGDFQCPSCFSYYPLVKAVQEKYNSEITFQFRNFPLPQHQNARAAHRAAEAASLQGKFWEMHAMLYENQKSWESSNNVTSIFEAYAGQIGLDLAKYRTDFASSSVNEVINADKAAGEAAKVDSTPTFFIDGKKVEPAPQDIDSFSKLIDDAIKAKTKPQ